MLEIHRFTTEIDALKSLRRIKSTQTQEMVFDQYKLINAIGDQCKVKSLFNHKTGKTPPSGAGDCAAPKLFQYAFMHQYTPIALAEFWWGKSPPLETRQHLTYHPACDAKCRPILTFMLQGLACADK